MIAEVTQAIVNYCLTLWYIKLLFLFEITCFIKFVVIEGAAIKGIDG